MRRLSVVLLAALLISACTPEVAAPAAPGEVTATRDPMPASFAPGDTVRYTLAWTAPATGPAPTGYRVNTTATGTGWLGMLVNASTAGLSVPFTPINTSGWSTVDFTGCVVSTIGAKASTPRCVTWTLARTPGMPGPVVVDSSLVIAAVILKPDDVALIALASQQFCPYARALDGKVRFIAGYEDLPECQGHYDAMPAADRLPGYPVALAQTSTRIPITPTWSVAVRQARDELAHLLFAGPFST